MQGNMALGINVRWITTPQTGGIEAIRRGGVGGRGSASQSIVHFLCLPKAFFFSFLYLCKETKQRKHTFSKAIPKPRFGTRKSRLNRVQGFPDSLRLNFLLLAEKEVSGCAGIGFSTIVSSSDFAKRNCIENRLGYRLGLTYCQFE